MILENEINVDYLDSRIQEKLIYYHQNDILLFYSKEIEAKKLHSAQLSAFIIEHSHEKADTLRHQIQHSSLGSYFTAENSLYVLKIN